METSTLDMLNQAQRAAGVPRPALPIATRGGARRAPVPDAPLWRTALTLVALHAPVAPRLVAAGDPIQRAGDPFALLHLLQSGACKSIFFGGDGHAQIVGLQFKGDWIGFDGIADARCATDVIALCDCRVRSLHYAGLLKVSVRAPALARLLAAAMSEQLRRNRSWRHALHTMTAVQRVADFLRTWIIIAHEREPHTDPAPLCMTRAEIGNYLGLTIETVSRALTRLERDGLIRILAKSRRHFQIPDLAMLGQFALFGACANPRQVLH